MPNPIEIIGNTRARLARLAAIRAFLTAFAPALTALALALLLDPIGDLTWKQLGYSITPERELALTNALLAVAAVALVIGAVMAFRAYRKADDFVAAATELDYRLDGDDQIVTLATLADPSIPESARPRRTPLFPVLWRHAMAYFEGFDPGQEFRLEVGGPLKRSTVFAGIVALAMALATLGLMRAPSPEQAIASKLRTIAAEIANSSSSTDDAALAEKIRAAADALENPKLPPEEKKQRIEEAMQQVDKADLKRRNSQSGKDQGTGKSNAQTGNGNSNGQGQSKSGGSGSGEGQSGTGSGKNPGGQGSGGNDKGNNNGAGKNNQPDQTGNNDKSGKGDQQSLELHNDLAKAEAQVETPGAKNPSPDNNQGGQDKTKHGGSEAGNNPNEKGGSQLDPNMPGNIPKPGPNGDRNIPSSGNLKDNKDRGSNLGDTHLGEMPAPGNYQRFLKPGDKGAALDIKDARYVIFRIPGAASSGGGGKTVLDTGRPRAATAYVNAPLAPTRDDAPPDERQLVPPRYRDMIH